MPCERFFVSVGVGVYETRGMVSSFGTDIDDSVTVRAHASDVISPDDTTTVSAITVARAWPVVALAHPTA